MTSSRAAASYPTAASCEEMTGTNGTPMGCLRTSVWVLPRRSGGMAVEKVDLRHAVRELRSQPGLKLRVGFAEARDLRSLARLAVVHGGQGGAVITEYLLVAPAPVNGQDQIGIGIDSLAGAS